MEPHIAADCTDQSFGLMRIGEALLALPVLAIREVISGRPHYSALPIQAEGLLGAVDVRGAIIPVLDLRHTLGLSSDEGVEHVIIIMRWRGYLLGLTADEVRGIARVPSHELFTLATAGDAPRATLATHTFQTYGTIVTLLDAQRIAELPNIPLVAENVRGAPEGLSTAAESILLFSVGASQLGIDTTCVYATVPTTKIERSALSTGYCLGVIGHHGHDVPVVDTRAAIGLDAPGPPPAEATIIIVRFSEQAMLGFAIDMVRDIVRVAASDVLPVPSLEAHVASLFRGMLVDANGRQNLLLDADRLRADPQLCLLAGFRKPRIALESGVGPYAVVHTGGTKSNMRTEPFLTYIAGSEQASPLGQITEILNHPTDVAPFVALGPGVLGLFTHRGRVAPLVCLATLLGRASRFDLETARVLFVEDAGRAVGFVVEALSSIEAATRHPPAPGDEHSRFRSLVMLGLGAQRRMVSNIDLAHEVGQYYRDQSPARSTTIPIPPVPQVAAVL